MVRLSCGNVMVAGGMDDNGSAVATAELFNSKLHTGLVLVPWQQAGASRG